MPKTKMKGKLKNVKKPIKEIGAVEEEKILDPDLILVDKITTSEDLDDIEEIQDEKDEDDENDLDEDFIDPYGDKYEA